MTRRHIATRERLEILTRASGRCHICAIRIDGLAERWDVEHVIPLALGGDEVRGSKNLQPAHSTCHAGKTPGDAGQIAKAKRVAAKHGGAFRSRAILPGSKASKWKKLISGEVVQRR